MSADAASVRVRSVELYERPVTLRLPFRFGAATVTRCPQAFVRVLADVNGHSVEGAGAELMVPKWFDKSPALTGSAGALHAPTCGSKARSRRCSTRSSHC